MGYIYKIENIVTGRIYIGSTKHGNERLRKHFNLLVNGNHPNKYLQNSWNKHGSHNFVFTLLEEVDDALLIEIEQSYINKCVKVYNIRITAESNAGLTMRQEIRDKISESMKRVRYKGSEFSKKHSEKMKGKVFADLEARKKRARTIKMRKWDGFISPDGVVYKDIYDLPEFAAQHNLNAQTLRKLGVGGLKTYKGWKRYA